jgi:arylsulfatase A-like enzyme
VPRGARARAPVDLLDIAPTILGLAAAPPGPDFQGRSLLDPWLETPEAAGRPLLSQLYLPSLNRTRQSSILRDGWRYIRHLDPEGNPVREQLFDRARDPEEKRDVSGEESERLAELRERLLEWEARLDSGEVRREESEELRERLRSLGYVD